MYVTVKIFYSGRLMKDAGSLRENYRRRILLECERKVSGIDYD